MTGRTYPRTFFRRDARAVARDLLGAVITSTGTGTTLRARIVETEAYLGTNDPASHSHRGLTPRNAVMFLDGGHLYVYFTYGMHFCANVVSGPPGRGEAVLIRAVEPLEGIGLMRRRRGARCEPREIANGPAKFCQAFGIGRDENGIDLCGGGKIVLTRGARRKEERIVATTRIGIRHAQEKRWRYYLSGNGFISRA
jgi:DNA-3-methyladenine glycosylase